MSHISSDNATLENRESRKKKRKGDNGGEVILKMRY